jgi:pimeloyl-ACP methyl ester carboxylesterase
MKLFHWDIPYSGEGEHQFTFVFLHGLFGSGKNWLSITKKASLWGDCYLFDARNHGDSPHSDSHNLRDMAGDLVDTMDSLQIKNPVIFGHSMGGLTAMYSDLNQSIQPKGLVIEDIAPRGYPFIYDNEVKAFETDVTGYQKREEIDLKIFELVPNMFMRQFLMMNLSRDENNKFFWKLNYKSIQQGRSNLLEEIFPDEPSNTPSLFLAGVEPDSYVSKEDETLIKFLYPNSKLIRLEGGGHFVHYTHLDLFWKEVEKFLNTIQ